MAEDRVVHDTVYVLYRPSEDRYLSHRTEGNVAVAALRAATYFSTFARAASYCDSWWTEVLEVSMTAIRVDFVQEALERGADSVVVRSRDGVIDRVATD